LRRAIVIAKAKAHTTKLGTESRRAGFTQGTLKASRSGFDLDGSVISACDCPPIVRGGDMRRLYWGSTVLLVGAVIAACGSDSRPGPVAPNQRLANGSLSASRSENGADDDAGENGRIAIRDDCDPNDPGWAPTGGCLLPRGDVSFAEFNAELISPLAASVVGHQAWRNDPSYVETFPGRTIRVRNEGGRTHTFTEVARFGGGKVPPLSIGLVTAPECPGSINIAPGDEMTLSSLSPGNHHFQCCIHPWMRALIKIEAHGEHGDR
jgi:plastocyanin